MNCSNCCWHSVNLYHSTFRCLFFNAVRESDLLSCWLWYRISFTSSCFRGCSYSSVLRNLYSLIEVVVSGHVPDNPCTALLVVIRRLQTQSRHVTPIHLSVYRTSPIQLIV